MFCPICASEYRPGFSECSDCHVALADQLPPEPEVEFLEFVELPVKCDEVRIALIKAAFEEADLDYYFDGEFASRLIPHASMTRLMIREDQAEEGRLILKERDLL